MSNEEEFHFYEELFENGETMPQRPRSHELETEAKNFLRGILPSAWVVHESKEDYGEDLRVEIFAKERATGLEFLVQLKATDKLTKRKHQIIQRVQVKTINYLLKKETPSLLMVYDSKAVMGYFVWIQDHVKNKLQQINPNWMKKKSSTFKIPDKNIFGYRSIDEIVSYLFFRRLPSQIEPLKLIDLLSSVSPMVDNNLLRNWLRGDHYEKLVKFLEHADVKAMIQKGTLTWDDISSLGLIWELRNSVKKAALGFAKKMAITLIERKSLNEAQEIISVISSTNERVCQELSALWWQQWSREPDLELIFPMIREIPEGIVSETYIDQIRLLLLERFGKDFEKVNELIKRYDDAGSWSVGFSPRDKRVVVNGSPPMGRFVPWLLWYGDYYSSAAKKLVDLLGFESNIRTKLHKHIDESEQFYWDETAH